MRGKREMRKSYTPFVAGMATMVLLLGLVSASLAAGGPPAGGPQPGQVSVGLFGREQIAKGETLTTRQGGKAPKVLTYPDSKGETHYYLEATAAAELFDVAFGAHYHEELERLEFGGKPRVDENGEPYKDADGNPVLDENGKPKWSFTDVNHDFPVLLNPSGQMPAVGENIPVEVGGLTVTVSSGPYEGPGAEEQWEKKRAKLPVNPEYGVSHGMFTEVDPAEINLGSFSGKSMDRQQFQDPGEIEHTFAFTTLLGKYAVITMENTGSAEAMISLSRPYTVGRGEDNGFTFIRLPAGEKITRAFRIDETKALENRLQLNATPLGSGGVSLKLTAEQYRSGS